MLPLQLLITSTGLILTTFCPSTLSLLPVFNHSFPASTNNGLDRLAQILSRRIPSSVNSNSSAPPVNIALYYETLCPYCQQFITKQLYPLHKQLGDAVVNVTFIPYGNAREFSYGGRYEYVCQHGIQECIGNNVHGCLLQSNLAQNLTMVLEFIHCTESSADYPSESVRKCALSVGVDYMPIERCAYDYHQYSQIMHTLAQTTHAAQPPVNGVPYVQIDGKYEPDASDDLLSFVCKAYKGEKPQVCNGAAAITVPRRLQRENDKINSIVAAWKSKKLC